MRWLRMSIFAVSLAGIAFSASGLALTAVEDRRFEDWAHRFVVWQNEREVREFITLRAEEGDGVLATMRNKLMERANLAERLLGSDFPERIAETAAELCVCRLDVEDRAEKRRRFVEARDDIASMIRAAPKGDLELNRIGIETLGDLIGGYYIETVEGLKRDLQIFFGSNLLLYAAVGAATLLSAAATPLVVPAALLLAGTLVSSSLYVFAQDWVSTILFHSWKGFAYLGWVGLITAFLADIFLNKVRVTSHIVSSISPADALPC